MIDSWLEVIDSELEGNSESAEEEAHDFLASLLGQCDRLLMSTEQKIIDHMRKTPSDASIALRRIAAGDDIDEDTAAYSKVVLGPRMLTLQQVRATRDGIVDESGDTSK